MTETTLLRYFADFIEKNLGILYTETNYFQLEHRLHEVVRQLGLKDLSELYARCQSGISGELKNLLLDLATNNETSFYRDPHVFTALSDLMIPNLRKDLNNPKELRIWSAAASSGQEVYTIAMEVEKLKKMDSTFPEVSFLATDVSQTILNRAETGIYSQLEVNRGLNSDALTEYFDQTDSGRWRVKDFLRRKIHFQKLNLLESFVHLGPFDIVYCRNVLIYQNVENKKTVINQLHQVLHRGGYLILGAAESLFGLSEDFEQVPYASTIVYRKK